MEIICTILIVSALSSVALAQPLENFMKKITDEKTPDNKSGADVMILSRDKADLRKAS